MTRRVSNCELLQLRVGRFTVMVHFTDLRTTRSRSSAYFLKKTYMLPSPVEDTYEIDKHIAVTEQHHSRLNAFSVCKSLLSQRLRRLKSAAIQGGAMTGPQTEEPVQNVPRRRPALKTIYRAPEDFCGHSMEHVLEMPATPRLNNFEPRFEGPEIAENRLLPSLSVKSTIIQRNSVITPTKQLPANVSLRRTVVFRPSPLRQVSGVVDLQRSGPETRDGQEESTDPEPSQRESVPGFEMPVQQRRRSGDFMIRVIQKEFRREVLERRRKRLAAQTEAEAAPVQMIPRKGSTEA